MQQILDILNSSEKDSFHLNWYRKKNIYIYHVFYYNENMNILYLTCMNSLTVFHNLLHMIQKYMC